jgi:HSP20 family protein
VQNMTSRTAIKIDVYEIGDAIVVRTQPLDGLVASSIEVSVEDKVLTFSGVTQADDAPVDASYILQERTFGTFSRQIALPLPVKAQEAKAKVKQGILTIELPIDRDSYTHIDIMD